MISRGEIDHSMHRAATRGPDADQTAADGFKRYAIDWICDGRTYTTHLWATGLADAERRFQALRSSGAVVGQVYAERDAG